MGAQKRTMLYFGKPPKWSYALEMEHYPCWFHRMMLRLVFGFYIVKEKYGQ